MHTPAPALPPAVSIVVPIYKVEKYLRQCVDSILGQTLTNIEIILVDDGSPDSCPAIVDEYAAADSRVIAIHQQNSGAGPARNTGLNAARGKYIIFLDADDIYEPDMFERMVAQGDEQQADVVICQADIFEGDSPYKPMPHQLRLEMLKGINTNSFTPAEHLPLNLFQFVSGWSWDKLYRRDFVLQTGLLFQALPHTNDAYFVYLSLVKASVATILPRVLVHHRMHNSSISHNTRKSTGSVIDALLAIHQEVIKTGNSELEKSFHHWAMNLSVWHVRQLYGDAAKALQQELSSRLEPVLHLLDYPRSYYPRKRDYLNYKEYVCSDPVIHRSIFCTQRVSGKTYHLLGLPVWSYNSQAGITTYRLFGMPVRRKRL